MAKMNSSMVLLDTNIIIYSKQEIIDEIGDVIIRVKIQIFGKEAVNRRVEEKLIKFKGFINEGKYTGGI